MGETFIDIFDVHLQHHARASQRLRRAWTFWIVPGHVGELQIRFADLELGEDSGHSRNGPLINDLCAECLLVEVERGARVGNHEIGNYLPVVWSSSLNG